VAQGVRKPGWGIPVDDEMARSGKPGQVAQSQLPALPETLDLNWMPKIYRGDIVFIDDGQEVRAWRTFWRVREPLGRPFLSEPVFFQVGYNSDKRGGRTWTTSLDDRPGDRPKSQAELRDHLVISV